MQLYATMNPKCETWSRHLGEFLFNQAPFLPHYHRRNNIESTMWMIKSKLGGAVRSKTPVAQRNEVRSAATSQSTRRSSPQILQTSRQPSKMRRVSLSASHSSRRFRRLCRR